MLAVCRDTLGIWAEYKLHQAKVTHARCIPAWLFARPRLERQAARLCCSLTLRRAPCLQGTRWALSGAHAALHEHELDAGPFCPDSELSIRLDDPAAL